VAWKNYVNPCITYVMSERLKAKSAIYVKMYFSLLTYLLTYLRIVLLLTFTFTCLTCRLWDAMAEWWPRNRRRFIRHDNVSVLPKPVPTERVVSIHADRTTSWENSACLRPVRPQLPSRQPQRPLQVFTVRIIPRYWVRRYYIPWAWRYLRFILFLLYNLHVFVYTF